jgi:hypothetical protein
MYVEGAVAPPPAEDDEDLSRDRKKAPAKKKGT